MAYTVYCHTNKINGKKYVGATSQKVEQRWKNGKGYKCCVRFHEAILKYGWEEFTHEILFTKLSKEEAHEKEVQLISKWKLQDNDYGYNICSDGVGNPGYERSDIWKSKQSEAHKGLFVAEKSVRFGKHHTEEAKIKMSKSRMGKVMTEETKSILSKQRKGELNARAKAVIQMDLNGNEIARFPYVKAAAIFLNMTDKAGISKCCKGTRLTAGGFKWKYAE